MTEAVKKLLKEMKTDDALIPGGCTKYIQGPNVSWNKPFQGYIMEFYDEWLATGVHQHTEAGNMKPASRELAVTWILEAWRPLDKTLIAKSFKSCSEDSLTHCFQNCASGSSILKEQLQLLKDADVFNRNPFEPTDSDIGDANVKDNLIDMDDTEDDFVIVDDL